MKNPLSIPEMQQRILELEIALTLKDAGPPLESEIAKAVKRWARDRRYRIKRGMEQRAPRLRLIGAAT